VPIAPSIKRSSNWYEPDNGKVSGTRLCIGDGSAGIGRSLGRRHRRTNEPTFDIRGWLQRTHRGIDSILRSVGKIRLETLGRPFAQADFAKGTTLPWGARASGVSGYLDRSSVRQGCVHF